MAPQRKRVLVVGAGAAGMACADGLSNHPDRFDVTLIGMYISFQQYTRSRIRFSVTEQSV